MRTENLKNVRFKRTDLWETYRCNFSVKMFRILHRLLAENVHLQRTDILTKTDGNDFSVEIFWNLQKLVSKNVRLWKRMVQTNSMNV